MHIACNKSHAKPYLQVMESYSVVGENGKLIDKKRSVLSLGPLEKFDDGQPDYLKRLRQSFKDGTPIISELNGLVSEKPLRAKIVIDPNNPILPKRHIKNIGYFVLDSLYDALGISDVMRKYKSASEIEYDVDGITKLLVFDRLLAPGSKIKSFEKKSKYVFSVAECDDLIEVYEALTDLDKTSEAIQMRMNHKITAAFGRQTDICFYDVTNYFFEIHKNDNDEYCANGEMKKVGLRKKGASKEHRPQPIVQMGLFIDNNGLPISYHLFPGNCSDQLTLEKAFEATPTFKNEIGKVICVADAGVNSGANICYTLDSGNGYIFPRSTAKSDKETKLWITDETEYVWRDTDQTFKSKSKIYGREVVDRKGNKRIVTEKLISYWSQKQYDKDVNENEKVLTRLQFFIDNPTMLTNKPKDIAKFLVEAIVDPKTGKKVKAKKQYTLDLAKVEEYQSLMGYYTVFTSETELDDSDIIHKYHGLSRIEDSFRITKSDLEARPVFVSTPEHINGHFLTCFCALVMVRLIQFKILKMLGKDTTNEDGWESGLTACRIKEALNSWTVWPFPEGYYQMSEISDDLQLILDAFAITPGTILPNTHDLRLLKSNVDKETFRLR
jgi:transposase